MLTSSLKKLSSFVLISLFIATFFSFGSHAADLEKNEGTITINVYDESGVDFAGRWYLRQGGSSGNLVRNGSKSETFNFTKGTYYLELQPKYPEHTYYTVFSTNPQTLSAGGNIKFEVQYFTEKDDLDDALAAGKPTFKSPKSTTTSSTSTSTTSSTTSSTSTTTSTTSSTSTTTSTPSSTSTTTKKINYYYVPAATFETAPPTSTTTTSATSNTSPSSSSSAASSVPQLAATGPGLLLFALAPLLGGLVIRRKK